MKAIAGAARRVITPSMQQPRPLLGWGDPKHIATRVALDIHARAVFFEDHEENRMVFVSVEVCFISESLRRGVMACLHQDPELAGLNEKDVVLTATHTHNAPGGYCHSILYNVPSKGYYPDVFEAYVMGIYQTIREAWRSRKPVVIAHGSGMIPLDEPVAFNRAMNAWNQNRDVEELSVSESHRAVDRNMEVLSILDSLGSPIALVSWFAVHCTSMHRDYFAIHSDNKGMASLRVEEHFRKQGSEMVAIFAQGASGDVSPNFRKYLFKREMRGADRDDERSCALNAAIQAEHALAICAQARPLRGAGISSILSYHDCTRVPVPPEWVEGRENVTTGPAALGCPFLGGTAEGGGMSPVALALFTLVLRSVYWVRGRKIRNRVHGSKIICLELTDGKVFGDSNPQDLPIPSLFDPVIRVMRFWSRIRVFKGETMTPHVLPFQLFRIGHLAFIAAPGEFTTTAGRRVRKMLEPMLKPLEVEHCIFSGYANSYAGYVTTEEEYEVQGYEGACTHFGQYTLLGYMGIFRQLAHQWTGKQVPEPRVPELPPPAMKSASYLRKINAGFFSRRG
jgi:neutral ceramidase